MCWNGGEGHLMRCKVHLELYTSTRESYKIMQFLASEILSDYKKDSESWQWGHTEIQPV